MYTLLNHSRRRRRLSRPPTVVYYIIRAYIYRYSAVVASTWTTLRG